MICVFCKRPMASGEPIIEGGCQACADKHYASESVSARVRELEAALRQAALDLGNIAAMITLGEPLSATLISGMESQARAALVSSGKGRE